jgi:protein SFI1
MSDQRWAKQAASALFGVARARRSETRAEIESHGDREDDERDEDPGIPARDADADAIGPGSTDPPLPAGALRAGETVAFLEDGLPYVADRAPTGEAVGFALSALEDAASVADPSTHLVVVRQGKFLGFRSASAPCDGKLLQARHRGRGRLCFYNRNHGVNEQWETPDEPAETGWTAATLRLRNRRLPSCVLRVTVTRVPPEMITGTPPHISRPSPAVAERRAAHGFGRRSPTSKTRRESRDALARDADRGSDSDSDSDLSRVPKPVARKVAFHEDEIGRAAAAAAAAEVQRTPYIPTPSGGESAAAGEEQTHALRSMSGVLIKEWSAFVLKEVRARKEVEQQMLELREEMRAMLEGFRGEVSATRQEWIGDASFYGANVRDAREAAAAQRRKVARMARATFSRRRTGDAFATWRVAAFQKRRRRVAMRRAAGRLIHTRLAKATAAWRQRARARRVARRAVARAVRVADAGATRRAFGAWRRATLADADAKRHERLVAALQRRAAGKMRLASASRAMAGWRERTRERRRLRGILRKTHARWTRAATADTFYAWLSVCFRETPPPRASVAARAPRFEPRAARRVSRLGARGACE